MAMLDYLVALTESSDLQAVWQLHCDKMAEFGFDRLVYGYTKFGTENSIGPREDALLLSNHAPEYFKVFIDEGHYLHAPLSDWAMNSQGARSWSYIREDYDRMTKRQQQVVDFNKANGVVAGYSIGFPSSSRRARGILALTARQGLTQSDVNEIWRREGREIEALSNIAHLKIISLPYQGKRQPLSPRQQEVLDWVALGKTNLDIATIMDVAPATVEKHLRLVREKMDVDTTAQAVLKASFQNQMFIVQT
ncbi:MAG TPA: LuxR family transcriptional regulator [Aliiroseovarius sp.]|nr:LuxR family transcriptional regulator [Aliiroseovarius sp.]